MRDPDLIVRAQEAATALEGAWCRWRNMHGLTADRAPAVSSYVGFSLDAPWGQPRIVFGICAEEAEQLATLLDRHDCVGPVHASVKAKPVGPVAGIRPAEDQVAEDGVGPAPDGGIEDDQTQAPGEPAAEAVPATQPGFVHVPAPSPASGDQQPLAASASSRSARPPAEQPDPRPREAAAAALTSQVAPRRSGIGTPIALAASRAVNASIASRRAAAQSSAAAVEGATEGGAPSDLNGAAGQGVTERGITDQGVGITDQEVRPDGDSPSEPPARPVAEAGAGEPAGLNGLAGLNGSAGQRSALDDETRIMTPGPESPGGLGQATDRRAVSDRRLAAEPRPEAGADGDAIGGPSDSAGPGLVAFRPRPEPAADYPDSRPRATYGNGRQAPAYDPYGPDRATSAADGQRANGNDADGRGPAGHDATGRQQVGYDADGGLPVGYSAAGRSAGTAESAELASSDRRPGATAQQIGEELTRPARPQRGTSLTRLRRPGSSAPANGWRIATEDPPPQGSGRPQDGRGPVSSAVASDAVAWNASELPGQAAITDTAV